MVTKRKGVPGAPGVGAGGGGAVRCERRSGGGRAEDGNGSARGASTTPAQELPGCVSSCTARAQLKTNFFET